MDLLSLSILICFDLFGIATSLCELKSVSVGFTATRGKGSNSNVVIKQCLGTCYNSVCEPLRTRIIKVESGNQFESDGGMFAVQRERGKRRRKSFPRQRSARALKRITPTDSPGSSSFPSSHYHHIKIPLTLEVVDHLDCHCALQVLNQVKVLASSQKGSLGSLMEPSQSPQMRPEDSSPTIHPIFTSTAFPPSSGSSPSLSSLANGSSESYQTCLACKKQAEICEVHGQVYDPNVCHCVYPASRTFLNSFYTLGVVMLTVMVCCFLVFGVQKGDENVLNSSRRGRSIDGSVGSSGSHHIHPRSSCSYSQSRFRDEDFLEDPEQRTRLTNHHGQHHHSHHGHSHHHHNHNHHTSNPNGSTGAPR